jgi:iron complex outermembrane receptor protein
VKIHVLWLSASVLALGWGGLAQAQTAPASAGGAKAGQPNTVEELVITAERREENLQKTAIAATVLSGADLQAKGVFTVDQLQFISPSLTVNNFGQGNDFNIRGIGKGEHNTQTSTGVITYRDGVGTFPGYIQEEPYYDIASVEVLRGPQGTFSGQNATGGAVIVNTNDPVIDGGHTGYILAHYGNYNDTQLQGAVNLPINDKLAARVAFNGQYRDTFYNLSGTPKGDPNVYWGSLRFSLLWQPTDALKVLWKTDYGYLDNGGYFGDPMATQGTHDIFNVGTNWKTYATDQFVRTILKADYVQPGTGITFRSISSYQQGRTGWTGDIDGTASNLPGQNNYFIDEAVNERMWTQEFNVISPTTGPLTWVAGLYYQNNRYDFPYGRFTIGLRSLGLDEDLNGINNTYTAAAFGQVSYDLPAGFQLQVGARYSKWSTTNRVTFDVPQLAFLPGFSTFQNETETGYNVTGKVTLNWTINDRNFLYAFVASGAKPGGLNTSLYFGGGIIPEPFRQEYVTDYEVGWKASFFDHRLNTQLGAFYNDFKHFQVIVPIPNNPLQATEINNPNPSKLYGLEASAQAVFGDLSFDAGLGLTHSEVGTFFTEDNRVATTAAPCDPKTGPATAVCIDLGGHPQTYAPEVTFNVSGRYNYHLAGGDILTPQLSYSHIGHQWATLFDNRAAGDYLEPRDIVSATLAWTHGDLITTAYIYNLTNDKYVAALLSPIRIAGAPRQFGISVLKSF